MNQVFLKSSVLYGNNLLPRVLCYFLILAFSLALSVSANLHLLLAFVAE